MKSTILLILLSSLFFFSLTLGQAVVNPNSSEISEKVGDLDFHFNPSQGISLSVFGVPVLKGSSLWVTTPDWEHRYYGYVEQPDLIKEARVEDFQGGKRIILNHILPPSKNCPFEGTETFILLPDNSYTVTLEFTFTNDTPAQVEWTIGGFNPYIIIGKPYETNDNKGSSRGIVPIEASFESPERSMLANGLRELDLSSRLGMIKITSTTANQLVFFDYRKNRWADANTPKFWVGALERPIKSGVHYSYSMSFHFPEKLTPDGTVKNISSAKIPITTIANAQIPNHEQNYIIPTPKQLKYTPNLFPLSSKTRICIGKQPGEGMEKALNFLLTELKEKYNINPQVLREDNPSNGSIENVIFLGELPRFKLPAQICKDAKCELVTNPEGYSLYSNDKLVSIAANNEKGIFYGITSLVQLIKVSEQGIFIKGAQIQDYPALPFRGIHCLSGKDAGGEIAKAVKDLMARFKINSMVWECEYIIWDSHPEIAHPNYGMAKSDARKVIDATRKYFIDLIPLVQSLGHSEWIFVNKQHLDIAEDPDKPYAYNPTDKDTYKFIFEVYQEALDFFKPKYFHIGHDEVTNDGRFPYRSKSSGKSVTELIIGDILKLHDWFEKKNVKVMMWGDMFLNKSEATDAAFAPTVEEAKYRRSLLPKDITITDWHYVADINADYKSFKVFKDSGFQTIGAPWSRPNNIRGLAANCIKYGADGLLQTTWAGFNFKITGNEDAWSQYWAYILAAEYAWTGSNIDPDKLPFTAKEVFLDQWFDKKPLLHKKKGICLDLSSLYNRKLADDAKGTGWIGYGHNYDLSSFPINQDYFGETKFKVTNSALFMSGKFNPKGEYPQDLDITIGNITSSEFHFLQTAAFRTADNTKVGSITLKYKDGTSASLDLIYGTHIFAFNDLRLGETDRIAWKGTTKGNQQISLWDLTWKNPHPDKLISSLQIHSTGTEAAPIFLAITGVSNNGLP